MTSQVLRFFLDHTLKQWLTGKKEREDENTKKIKDLKNENSFLD